MPHTDYPPSDSAWSPGKNDEPLIEPPDGYETWLTVVLTLVSSREVRTRKNLPGASHVKSTRMQRLLSFPTITGDAHIIIVATLKGGVNRRTQCPELSANVQVQQRRADLCALALYPSPSAATGCYAEGASPSPFLCRHDGEGPEDVNTNSQSD